MIRTRLTVWNTVVLAAVLTFLGLVAFVSTRASLYGAVDEDLNRRAQFLVLHWQDFPKTAPPEPAFPSRPGTGIDPAQFRRIEFEAFLMMPRISRPGEVIHSRERDPFDKAALQRSLNGQREMFDFLVDGRRVRVLSVPLKIGGKITGAAQFAASLENADIGVARLARVLLILLPLALLATSITGVWLTRRALRPVAEIASTASQIEATNLSGRLSVQGRDEFANLASVFNSMLERLESSFRTLEESYDTQRRFIADASHELKTPLTAIKTRLGVARRKEQTPERYAEHLQAIERSTNSMSSIVADLLLLARSDEGKLLGGSRTIPLESLAEESVSVVSDAHGREIERDIEAGLTVQGDESGISRVLTNLLDNAARYTPPSGHILLSAYRAGGHVIIKVKDAGIGIPPEDLPHVFDRFYRVAAARDRESGGTGLGLAIVRSIVRAHHGTVVVESELGRGTTFTIDLPSA